MARLKKYVAPSTTFSLDKIIKQSIKSSQKAWNKNPDNAHNKRDKAFHLSFNQGVGMPIGDERYCRRQQAILRYFVDELEPWVPDVKLQKVFDLGHEIHGQYQKYLRNAGAYDSNVGLYGRWKCKQCLRIWYAFAPKGCGKCGAGLFDITYREYPFSSKKLEIKTTSDGLIWWYNSKEKEWEEWMIELKSIQESGKYYGQIGFNELNEPIDKHVMQQQGYAGLRVDELARGPKKRLPPGFTEWPKFKGLVWAYINKNGPEEKIYQQPYKPKFYNTIQQRIRDVQSDEAVNKFAPRIRMCGSYKEGVEIAKCRQADICFNRIPKSNRMN